MLLLINNHNPTPNSVEVHQANINTAGKDAVNKIAESWSAL
jgi:hypothetical protein